MMELLRQCLPQLRYIRYYLKGKKLETYLKTVSNSIVKCIAQISLNLMYSHKNGINLNKLQIKKLKPFEKSMKALFTLKSVKKQKKLLKKPLVYTLLSVMLPIADKMGID